MSKGACIQKVVLIRIFKINKRKNTMFLGIVVIPIGKISTVETITLFR